MVLSPGLLRIRRSARAFARAPGLAWALLLTIALGVGGNAAVYGFLEGLTHPESPLRDSGRVVSIFLQDRSRDAGLLSPEDYRLLKGSQGLLDWTGAARINPTETVIDGRSELMTVAFVTPSLARALAIPLVQGAVISHRMWENRFDGSKAVGSPVRVDGADLRISGVAPVFLDGLYSNQKVDLWIQSREPEIDGADQGGRDLWVLARLHDGVSIRRAQAAIRSQAGGIREASLIPFSGLAPDMARGLAHVGLFLDFAAGAVFFIACINVASFLLGRALRRSHETSLRIALGATRAELLRDLFADSVVVSIAGGALGLLLGILTARALPAFLFEEDAERLSFAPHWVPIVTATILCIAVTMLCGMLPVAGTVTDRPWMVLQRETGSPSRGILRLRSGLVVSQITACCMLVVCTTLLLNGLHSALETSAGHRLGNPILLTVQAEAQPSGPETDVNYFYDVEKKAKSVAGLQPLAWTAQLPGSQPRWRTFRVQPLSTQFRDIASDTGWLSPGSLNPRDYELLAGKMFGFESQSRKVAIVDQEAATKIFGLQTVGVVIRDSADVPIEIIGVIKRKASDAGQPQRPTIYYNSSGQSNAPHPIHDARFHVPLAVPLTGVELNANTVSANYFSALDMRSIAGQTFPENPAPGRGRVAVINQEAADLYFNGKPIGAGVIDESGMRTEIAGVVRSQVFGTFEKHAEPAIYFPMRQRQDCPPRMTLILKHGQWNDAMSADFRGRIEMVPGRAAAPIGIKTLDTQLAQSGLAPLRIATLIGGSSAAMALILSILGLLSAQRDAERQRRRERALRIALGAQRRNIVLLVMKDAVLLAIVGTVAGTFLSFVLFRILIAVTGLVAPPPFQVWLIAPLLPAAAVVIASMIPARRASAVAPSTILRDS